MHEPCPTCGSQVVFSTTVCPNCQIDRVNPDPAKLAEWTERARRRLPLEQQLQIREKAVVQRAYLLAIANLLIAAAAIVLAAGKAAKLEGNVGTSGYSVVFWVLLGGGGVLTLLGLFKRKG